MRQTYQRIASPAADETLSVVGKVKWLWRMWCVRKRSTEGRQTCSPATVQCARTYPRSPRRRREPSRRATGNGSVRSSLHTPVGSGRHTPRRERPRKTRHQPQHHTPSLRPCQPLSTGQPRKPHPPLPPPPPGRPSPHVARLQARCSPAYRRARGRTCGRWRRHWERGARRSRSR